jgi:hypothetical protein
MAINDYTGKEETRKKIVLEQVQAQTAWDSDLGITFAKIPDGMSLPKTFLGKKFRLTAEIVEEKPTRPLMTPTEVFKMAVEPQTEKAWKQEKANEKAFVEKLIQQKENELQELNDRLTNIVQELEGEDPYLGEP